MLYFLLPLPIPLCLSNCTINNILLEAGDEMKDIRILIADDEKEIRDLLKRYLERELYMVDTAINGEEALHLFNQNDYNLVILDLMMPKVDGIEVCRKLRDTTNIPILMLTAKDHEVDKVLGLSIGADDYITKPFSIHEVVARVKSLMRRFLVLGSNTTVQEKTTLTFKGLTIDFKKYTSPYERTRDCVNRKKT